MIFRSFRATDAQACFDLFRVAIHEGAAAHYNAAQRAAWAGSNPMTDLWRTRLAQQYTIVAVEDGVQGFMSLRADGYLDLAFVHPDRRRSGLAAELLSHTIAQARALGLTRLYTEASHLARRFFAKHGWQEDGAQIVERGCVQIENFRMSRAL